MVKFLSKPCMMADSMATGIVVVYRSLIVPLENFVSESDMLLISPPVK